jgi:uncharacterized membrane protein
MKKISLSLLSIFYILAGLNHFLNPAFYLPLIPPYLPLHHFINIFSGSIEILFGILLIPTISRKWAVYGIIAMLVAFISSHVYFIQINSCIEGGLCVSPLIGWIRLLVVHPLLIYWAWSNRK